MGADDETSAQLDRLGLHAGEEVRWRRKAGGHWHKGVVIGIEPDGSVAVRDSQERWRSIVPAQLEARGQGARGGMRWESVGDRADRPAQLDLFG